MRGFRFSEYIPVVNNQTPFERLLDLFLELLNYTSGDVDEALAWMNELDREHGLTDDDYGMGDFIEDLKKNGYIQGDEQNGFSITSKTEQSIRQQALEQIFGKLKKAGRGSHRTNYSGAGKEPNGDRRKFRFGDSSQQIDFGASIKNAHMRDLENFSFREDDFEVVENDFQTSTSTVLMIDVSHSMILYGEDRITPAKKVAMALAELITRKYKNDTLDILAFGNDAWQIEIKDLPYLKVGPFHTNTIAGLELAMDILRRRKNPNRQIFMITDGKPTCMKEGKTYYKNSYGIDRRIWNRTMALSKQCRKLNIPITTFMIARDPYLQDFVREFTEVNNGKAFYSTLEGLGEYIFEDYARNKKRNTR